MSLYRFLAKDLTGKKFTGEVEAFDEKALVTTLRSEGLIPIELKRRESLGLPFLKALPKAGSSVSLTDVVTFTRQLSTMVSAGIPLPDALIILEKQSKSQTLTNVLAEVVADVQGGMALSASLAKHPRVFDIIYVKLIEAGETGGVLDKVLMKLAETLEKEREFKSKTKGAFIYPAIVVTVMIIVMVVMMIFVIPKLTVLYTEIGAQLPLPTRILIAISNFMRSFWWLLILMGAIFMYSFRVFSKTEEGAKLLAKVVLRLPIWGNIRKSITLAEFTRTLGLLISAGIPIITALRVVANILASPSYKEGIDFAISRVERGFPLYQPLAANPAFPPIVSQMIRVGEETGKMDELLTRLSYYFESESEQLIRNLTTALEPVILVVLGLGVGVLVLSIILPIYNLTAQF